eukprot:scaffold63431_cov18-Tisochrysis_lutea.AAC.5
MVRRCCCCRHATRCYLVACCVMAGPSRAMQALLLLQGGLPQQRPVRASLSWPLAALLLRTPSARCVCMCVCVCARAHVQACACARDF